MTPAEIRTLADAAEAETASVKQVALVLGWQLSDIYDEPSPIWWRDGECSVQCPPLTTDLNALAAECARRGRGWSIDLKDDSAYANVDICDGYDVCAGQVVVGPGAKLGGKQAAAALCAALLRAVAADKEADDGTE